MLSRVALCCRWLGGVLSPRQAGKFHAALTNQRLRSPRSVKLPRLEADGPNPWRPGCDHLGHAPILPLRPGALPCQFLSGQDSQDDGFSSSLSATPSSF